MTLPPPTPPPPGAPRSPDGAWWWDGADWQADPTWQPDPTQNAAGIRRPTSAAVPLWERPEPFVMPQHQPSRLRWFLVRPTSGRALGVRLVLLVVVLLLASFGVGGRIPYLDPKNRTPPAPSGQSGAETVLTTVVTEQQRFHDATGTWLTSADAMRAARLRVPSAQGVEGPVFAPHGGDVCVQVVVVATGAVTAWDSASGFLPNGSACP